MRPAPADIAGRVRPVLTENRQVVAAYLFGSAAAGRLRPGSDMDIAVLLDEASGEIDRKMQLERLLPPLCRALRHDVHLVFLNQASYLLRAQVIDKGMLIYVSDKEQLALFRMKSLVLYAEFAPHMRMFQKSMKARMSKPDGG